MKARKRVLVVDDEPDNCTIFKIALEDDGFDVDTFNDSTSALSAFKPNYYDALMFDIRIPVMSGYELYDKVKSIDNKVKVCFLTAYSVMGEGRGQDNNNQQQVIVSIKDTGTGIDSEILPRLSTKFATKSQTVPNQICHKQ